MPTATFSLTDCKAIIRVTPRAGDPLALKDLVLSVMHPKRGEIATLTAVLINRRACGHRFHKVTAPQTEPFALLLDKKGLIKDLTKFSTTLFDPRGLIREELIDHEYHQGTGVWGREINNGLIAYIFSLNVRSWFIV